MSYPPVIDYLLNTAEPTSYQIFRAFIIAHDSQDLNRFHQWVDRLVGVYVPLLDVPRFIQKRIARALVGAKTNTLIVKHLVMSDHVRTARILSSPSPPQTQHQA